MNADFDTGRIDPRGNMAFSVEDARVGVVSFPVLLFGGNMVEMNMITWPRRGGVVDTLVGRSHARYGSFASGR